MYQLERTDRKGLLWSPHASTVQKMLYPRVFRHLISKVSIGLPKYINTSSEELIGV